MPLQISGASSLSRPHLPVSCPKLQLSLQPEMPTSASYAQFSGLQFLLWLFGKCPGKQMGRIQSSSLKNHNSICLCAMPKNSCFHSFIVPYGGRVTSDIHDWLEPKVWVFTHTVPLLVQKAYMVLFDLDCLVLQLYHKPVPPAHLYHHIYVHTQNTLHVPNNKPFSILQKCWSSPLVQASFILYSLPITLASSLGFYLSFQISLNITSLIFLSWVHIAAWSFPNQRCYKFLYTLFTKYELYLPAGF